jgi:hypothetical protein
VTPQDIVAAAYNQQQRTGKKDADVSLVIPGKWPPSGKKRLFGRGGGPLGRCIVEYEDAVLCLFRADELIVAVAPLLPTITIGDARKGDQP